MKINLSNLSETLILNTSATSSGYFWNFILVSRDAKIFLNITLLLLSNYICLFVCSFSMIDCLSMTTGKRKQCVYLKVLDLKSPPCLYHDFNSSELKFHLKEEKRKDDPCLSLTRERRCQHDPFKALPNF